jgi:hypothetical protein
MNPEARFSAYPVLLLKLTMEVPETLFAKGLATTDAAARSCRSAYMVESQSRVISGGKQRMLLN